MEAMEQKPFFNLLDSPVCQSCGHHFWSRKDYWKLRKSKTHRAGPRLEGLVSHITDTTLTCPRCDRSWTIQVLWAERWERCSPRPVPHDGMQILRGETPDQVMRRMIDARRAGERLTVVLPPPVARMNQEQAVAAKNHIAAIRRMMGD